MIYQGHNDMAARACTKADNDINDPPNTRK